MAWMTRCFFCDEISILLGSNVYTREQILLVHTVQAQGSKQGSLPLHTHTDRRPRVTGWQPCPDSGSGIAGWTCAHKKDI